jgi:hypothetical protein
MTDEADADNVCGQSQAGSTWRQRLPGVSARCAGCGSDEISNVPTFATGSGSVFRTLDDDVYCRRCGAMGQPNYEISEEERKRTVPEPVKKGGKQGGQTR